MFYEINKSLCNTFTGLDPLRLLDYPIEDVIDLINNTLSYNARNSNNDYNINSNVMYKPAGDDWF